MQTTKIKQHLSITDTDISEVTQAILKGMDLTETKEWLGGRLTKERIYAIAFFVSEEVFFDLVMNVAPRMFLERVSMNELKYGDWQEILDKRIAARKKEAEEEDEMLCLKEAEARMQAG